MPPNLPYQLARMGQEPLLPPSVKGWDGGPSWINTSTLLARFNFVNGLIAQTAPGKNGVAAVSAPNVAPDAIVARTGMNAARVAAAIVGGAVQDDVTADVRATLVGYLDSSHADERADQPAPVRSRELPGQDPRRARADPQPPRQPVELGLRMRRKDFVTSALSVAFLGGSGSAALAQAAGAPALPAFGGTVDPDNVLVVVQMQGGNDGLNTVVPWSDDAYHRVRPAIGIPETQVLKLNDRIGFNPALKGLNELYKQGRVALVQGVGYPNPNRSHFEATQIWETASPDRPQQYGWLGRYLDRRFAADKPKSLFEAVALGDTLPAALVAAHVEVPAIGALNAYGYNTGRDLASKQSAGVLYDGAKAGQSPYLALIANTAREAYHGGDVLRAQTAAFTNKATYAPNGFAQQLALAARLIGSSAGSKIVFVSLGSFDTHAGQRAQQDRLLGYLGDGLLSFYQDLAAHGLDQQRADADLQRVRPPRAAERLQRHRPRHRDAAVRGGRHASRAASTASTPRSPTSTTATSASPRTSARSTPP